MSAEGSNTLTFHGVILGFENIKQYQLLFLEDDLPFFNLQAVGSEDPCFIVCDPNYFIPDYKLYYDSALLKEMDAESPDDLRYLAIVTISDQILDATANLKSPIIINLKNNLAKQFVFDHLDYSIRHKLFDCIGAVE